MPKPTSAGKQQCAIDACSEPATTLVELSPAAGPAGDGSSARPVWPTWMCAAHGDAWKRHAR